VLLVAGGVGITPMRALFETLPGAAVVRGPDLDALGDPARLLLSVDTLEDLSTIGGRLPDGEDTARR
jgi:hypothetical protein